MTAKGRPDISDADVAGVAQSFRVLETLGLVHEFPRKSRRFPENRESALPLGNFASAGVSLLEIIVAVSILGICFSALFSGFSAALRATDRVDRYSRAVEFSTAKLNELMADPSLRGGDVLSGVTPSGLHWRAVTEVSDKRPGPSSDRSIELIHVVLEVSWPERSGTERLVLQTMKLSMPQPVPNT